MYFCLVRVRRAGLNRRCGLAAQNILTVFVIVVAIGFGLYGYQQFRGR